MASMSHPVIDEKSAFYSSSKVGPATQLRDVDIAERYTKTIFVVLLGFGGRIVSVMLGLGAGLWSI